MTVVDRLERRGALTDFDRNNAQKQTRDYIRRACTPPRVGLAARI